MPNKRKPLVLEIILGNMENFGKLLGTLTDADYKKIYNRCYKRLHDRKIPKHQIKNFIKAEIESELFSLLPKFEPKTVTDVEKQENGELEKPSKQFPIKLRGFKMWGNNEKEVQDELGELEKNYNLTVEKAFAEVFCSRCKSNPCICRYEEE
jgi:hypothetical protein